MWGRDTSYGLEENWKMDKVFHFGLIGELVDCLGRLSFLDCFLVVLLKRQEW